MLPFAGIATVARERDLAFLVIGGHAVNELGYSRLTFDLDLLIEKDDRDAWLDVFTSLEYGVFNDGGSFLQLAAPVGSGAWPVDLMLVARATFAEMLAVSSWVDPRSPRVRNLFTKYGTENWHARILESFRED